MSLYVFFEGNHVHTYPARGNKAYQLILKTFSEILFSPEDSSSPLVIQTPREMISKVYRYLPRDRSVILLLATSTFLSSYAHQSLDDIRFYF